MLGTEGAGQQGVQGQGGQVQPLSYISWISLKYKILSSYQREGVPLSIVLTSLI